MFSSTLGLRGHVADRKCVFSTYFDAREHVADRV
jgi:hypothetical protein